jgi:hypothetical protein
MPAITLSNAPTSPKTFKNGNLEKDQKLTRELKPSISPALKSGIGDIRRLIYSSDKIIQNTNFKQSNC